MFIDGAALGADGDCGCDAARVRRLYQDRKPDAAGHRKWYTYCPACAKRAARRIEPVVFDKVERMPRPSSAKTKRAPRPRAVKRVRPRPVLFVLDTRDERVLGPWYSKSGDFPRSARFKTCTITALKRKGLSLPWTGRVPDTAGMLRAEAATLANAWLVCKYTGECDPSEEADLRKAMNELDRVVYRA